MKLWLNIVCKALLIGFATFVATTLISCIGLTICFSIAFPHDGQDGLGGVFYGFFIGVAVGIGVFIWKIYASSSELS
jgi:hypothetical protein